MLECLSLASLSSLVLCLCVRPGAYPKEEQLEGASLRQIGWKGLSEANEHLEIAEENCFMSLVRDHLSHEQFSECLPRVQLSSCNYCVYCIWIFSNKLDLNPETSFYYKCTQHDLPFKFHKWYVSSISYLFSQEGIWSFGWKTLGRKTFGRHSHDQVITPSLLFMLQRPNVIRPNVFQPKDRVPSAAGGQLVIRFLTSELVYDGNKLQRLYLTNFFNPVKHLRWTL